MTIAQTDSAAATLETWSLFCGEVDPLAQNGYAWVNQRSSRLGGGSDETG